MNFSPCRAAGFASTYRIMPLRDFWSIINHTFFTYALPTLSSDWFRYQHFGHYAAWGASFDLWLMPPHGMTGMKHWYATKRLSGASISLVSLAPLDYLLLSAADSAMHLPSRAWSTFIYFRLRSRRWVAHTYRASFRIFALKWWYFADDNTSLILAAISRRQRARYFFPPPPAMHSTMPPIGATEILALLIFDGGNLDFWPRPPISATIYVSRYFRAYFSFFRLLRLTYLAWCECRPVASFFMPASWRANMIACTLRPLTLRAMSFYYAFLARTFADEQPAKAVYFYMILRPPWYAWYFWLCPFTRVPLAFCADIFIPASSQLWFRFQASKICDRERGQFHISAVCICQQNGHVDDANFRFIYLLSFPDFWWTDYTILISRYTRAAGALRFSTFRPSPVLAEPRLRLTIYFPMPLGEFRCRSLID